MASAIDSGHSLRNGTLLVFGSALAWSFGGTIGRFISITDSWTIVFWRSLFAAAFLLGFLLWRDGIGGTVRQVRAMGWPSYLVSFCFFVASTSFVIALKYTTVANILLVQAGVPLLAALMGWVLFRERTSAATWTAIALVLIGIGIMVWETLSQEVSLAGDGLAILIAVMFSTATVTTRRHADVRMTIAVLVGVVAAACVAGVMAGSHAVSVANLLWLILFGAVNLGLGLVLFTNGARMIPAAAAALIGTMETVLGPVWVWLFHGEMPGIYTVLGGAIVFAALIGHIAVEAFRDGARVQAG